MILNCQLNSIVDRNGQIASMGFVINRNVGHVGHLQHQKYYLIGFVLLLMVKSMSLYLLSIYWIAISKIMDVMEEG